MATTSERHQRAHPSPAWYVAIALILSVITMVEVGVVYTDGLRSVLLPILLALSGIKFAMVAMFYMHLRFDNRLFSAFFVGGILLTIAILVALMSLFRVFFA